MYKFSKLALLPALSLLLSACEPVTVTVSDNVSDEPSTSGPSVEEAVTFVADAEERLAGSGQHSARMAWVLANFITEDTEQLAAKASEQFTAAQVDIAAQAARFIGLEGLDYDTGRKLNMLRSDIVIPASRDAAKAAEQAEIGAKMKGLYGKGSYCRAQGECLALGDLEEIMAHSREPDELLEAWEGWRTISPPMKDLYARQVEMANEGAIELGFHDLGTMWRSAYDMDPGHENSR